MTQFDPNMTIRAAQNELRGLLDEGHTCPVCTQFAKVYRRKLNAGMCVSLIRMWRRNRGFWIHVPTEIGARSREEGKLRYWGLVEEAQWNRDDGGRAGWWRVTPLGGEFVRRDVRVLSHARIYDGRCLNLVGEPVDIVACLGKRFNYHELMTEQIKVA